MGLKAIVSEPDLQEALENAQELADSKNLRLLGVALLRIAQAPLDLQKKYKQQIDILMEPIREKPAHPPTTT